VVDGPQSRRLPALVEVVLIKNGPYLDARRSAEERGRQRDENDGRSTVKCNMASRKLDVRGVVPVSEFPAHTTSRGPPVVASEPTRRLKDE